MPIAKNAEVEPEKVSPSDKRNDGPDLKLIKKYILVKIPKNFIAGQEGMLEVDLQIIKKNFSIINCERKDLDLQIKIL